MTVGYERRRKELRYLKKINPDYTSRVPTGRILEHLEMLQSYGWTHADVERKSGVGRSVVSQIALGISARVYADTEAAILGVKLTPFDLEHGPGLTVEGRKVGAHRIVTGLIAVGWTYAALGRVEAGWSAETLRTYAQNPKGGRNQHYSRIAKERYVELRDFAHRVEKLDPQADGGVPLTSSRLAITKARKLGYPPIGCWDLETVHFPDAVPEWTGACGTPEGYRIHLRERIKTCPPCLESIGRTETAGAFSPTKFRILLEQSGLTPVEMAEKVGATRDSIARWSAGERNPGAKYIDLMCAALDCSEVDLFDTDGEVYYDKDFNREKFVLALESSSMSKRQLAMEIGLSNMAVHYWCTGQNTPKIPKIVKAADALGVDWKEFYR